MPKTFLQVTDSSFSVLVEDGSMHAPVLVDVWAPHCAPCRALEPWLNTLQLSMPNLTIVKLNAEAEVALAQRWQIKQLPTLLLFVGGKLQARAAGVITGKQLQEFMASVLMPTQINATDSLNAPALLAELEQLIVSEQFEALAQKIATLPDAVTRAPEFQLLIARVNARQFKPEPNDHHQHVAASIQNARRLAAGEDYCQAIEILLAIEATPDEREIIANALLPILDTMPDRRRAHQYRRLWLQR
ncbi:MAG: thioredoxin domain-containing protein [Thalassolituus sp.]|uniref:thioredoxin family protein n=1 Tax=Thalassolituus sp. TaxID=2030822 RepID=UPI003982667C